MNPFLLIPISVCQYLISIRQQEDIKMVQMQEPFVFGGTGVLKHVHKSSMYMDNGTCINTDITSSTLNIALNE